MSRRSSPRGPLRATERSFLDQLVSEFGARVEAYVRRAFGRGHDVEEVVAETFCRAAENIAAVMRCERRDLYLLAVARNLCHDSARRRRPEALGGDELDRRPSAVGEAGALLGDDEQRSAVLAAVERLPDSQREIVVLRMSGGLSFEEISALLEIPLGTALSRMHHAVRRLRAELGVRV